MKLSRRRFLSVCAAFAVAPQGARAHSWQGRAFGADVSLTIHGSREQAETALAAAREIITEVEKLFSLYDPASALVRLNRTKQLPRPDAKFLSLMHKADRVHTLTQGLFDPTVQALWQALSLGKHASEADLSQGWGQVRFGENSVTLQPNQSLTFNGIAQGFATDLVSDALVALGVSEMLVNIGEYRGVGGPWRLGLSDPDYGHLGTRTITNAAIATSSPATTQIGQSGHILHRSEQPKWSTVSVVAKRAVFADAFSTALALADQDMIETLVGTNEIHQITLVDFEGNVTTLG
ncbi:FAD:protein FMN transferase [Shimia sp.]|uniref:FAD:protein FMN transferase n=1 Tax=Shimia sp. TaxID=1954381 RepID=UPI003297E858